ncbi:MAG: amino acid permease [Solirubrobacterales bacterium]|nr:amino acid permease [Solirubrobacterales bacterium]
MSAPDSPPSQAKIGPVACLAFAVGVMVGGGVFSLSGIAINDAGPAALLAYLIAGGVMLLSALSFVAVSARAREGDSGYGPVGDLLGPGWRFLVMWAFYINAVTLMTFVLVSFGHYLNEYFVSAIGPLPAALIAIGALSLLNMGPIDNVGKAETYVVAIKIAILIFFVAWGLAEIGHASFTPFSPDGSGGVLATSALLFTAYTGFNVVTNIAGSVRDPERNVPIAIIGSILISATIYVGVIVAMLASGVRDFGDAGVGQAATALIGDWGGYLIAGAACLSTLSGANANMLGASEIALRLVAQGDAPPAAGRSTAGGRPFVSVLTAAAIAVALVLLTDLNAVIVFSNVAALVAMIVVNVAAFRLARRGWPGRGMRLPGGILIPVLAAVACLLQFPSFDLGQLAIGLALVAAGMPIYLSRHSNAFGGQEMERARRALATLSTPLHRAMLHTPFRRRPAE